MFFRIHNVSLLLALLIEVPALARDLEPGDRLPDCRKIPLLAITSDYQPEAHRVASLEDLLLSDGVVILHFCSPRPPRRGAFKTFFIEELSALQKAAQSVPYPCTPVAVVPFGEKGRRDAATLLAASEEKPWGNTRLFYEPTFPRPGLYRTFRPGSSAAGEREITTAWTYLIGPGREILAVRAPGEDGQLYDWLQQNLPDQVVPVPREPSSDLSFPAADPWTWPAFRRTVRRAAEAPRVPNTLPYTYLAWQAPVGRTFASPAVMDGTVYVATDTDGLKTLTLNTGEELQSFYTGSSWWTSPAVAGDYVYTISSAGTVFALDRAALRPKWQRNLGSLITSSPVVSDGALYVGSRSGAVYALDAATGEILWRFQTGGEISSSPALADGLVVIGSGDRSLYALDARTGQEKWSFPTGAAVDSSPTIADGDVLVGSFDGGLYSIRLADGQLHWRCELGGWVHSSPAVAGDTVFVGTVNVRHDETPTFNWIDRKTGQRQGSFTMPDAVYSSPTVWEDVVLVGCRDRHLYAFDRAMKQTQPLWTFQTRSYVHASPVVVGDTVLVASFDGSLYALRQAKPIQVWTESDVVPRWFMAALAEQLHRETADLIARAAAGLVGEELSLTPFDPLFQEIKGRVLTPGAAPKILPRDVPSEHPGAPFIEYVLTAGLLAGYPDGTFHPSDPTTRYQFSSGLAAVLAAVTRPDYVWRVLRDRGAPGGPVEVRAEPLMNRPRTLPVDVPGGHWAYQSLAELAEKGILPVGDEGQFKGKKLVTLRDAAAQWNLLVESLKVVRAE